MTSTTTATTTDTKTQEPEEAANAPTKPEMEYRMLGKTGLKVSTFSYGFFATFGVKPEADVKLAVNILRHCRKAGINFFDNAEAYGNKIGDAEVSMGNALKKLVAEDPVLWRRSELVISTKIFWGGNGQNELGLSYKHIQQAMNDSLRRLQLDYVDIVFCHRADELTPTEEVVRAMNKLIADGKACYWGTSCWTADHIMEAIWIAKSLNLIEPCVEQPQYNMFTRDPMESEYLRLFAYPYRMGTTIWGPLHGGILTGKYNDGIPKDSRMAIKKYKYMNKFITDDKIAKVKVLTEYAVNVLNTSVTVLAIAWCAKCKNVSTVLLGASKEYQILENLKAIEVAVRLTKKNMDEIDEILGNVPVAKMKWGRELKVIIDTL